VRLLVNENIPLASVAALREAGHDVASITENSPGISDEAVMQRARADDRIIVTFDSDYGELVFRRRLPTPGGVLYLRFLPENPLEPASYIAVRSKSDKSVRNALTQWYKSHAEKRLKQKVERYARIIGVQPVSVGIKSFKSRWGVVPLREIYCSTGESLLHQIRLLTMWWRMNFAI